MFLGGFADFLCNFKNLLEMYIFLVLDTLCMLLLTIELSMNSFQYASQ